MGISFSFTYPTTFEIPLAVLIFITMDALNSCDYAPIWTFIIERPIPFTQIFNIFLSSPMTLSTNKSFLAFEIKGSIFCPPIVCTIDPLKVRQVVTRKIETFVMACIVLMSGNCVSLDFEIRKSSHVSKNKN